MDNNLWSQNSLKFNIMLQIEGADVQIKDLDIDFEIYKSDGADINTADIKIWNLNDTTYRRILEKTYSVDIYTWYGDDEPALIFRGYVDSASMAETDKFSGIFPNGSIENSSADGNDVVTTIKLIDGKMAYTAKKINKNYREKVSSTQIIKDCIEAMGVGIARFSENLPAVEYKTYKAVGNPHVVMQKICAALNIKFCITNDLIQVIAPDEEFDGEFAILLTPENSMRPERIPGSGLAISTRLIPFVNPNDFIKCDFKEFTGVERVRKVYHRANNYGTEGISEVLIGLDKLTVKEQSKKNENL